MPQNQDIDPFPASKPDRRANPRHSCDGFAEVVVCESGALFRGEIHDLSDGGCYIKTRAILRIKRPAEVEIRFTVNDNRFSVVARVVSLHKGLGAGFQFLEMDLKMHKRLIELIAQLKAAAPQSVVTAVA